MKKLVLTLTLVSPLLLAACSDSLAPDNGDNGPVSTEHFETVDNGGGAFTTTMTATDDISVYFRLADASEATPSDPAHADDYDLAIQFANIDLNGGVHGTGGVELVYYDDEGYDALVQAPADGYLSDTSDDDSGRAFNQGATAEQNGGWYHYNPNTHQMTIAANRYYVIHSLDGGYFKFRIVDFVYAGPGTPLQMRFDWQEVAAP